VADSVKRDTLPLLLLLLLAFGLRVWGLADHNIWWDEGVGAYLARLPVVGLLEYAAHDVHPPLHYLVLRAWWLIVGDGEYLLRFPSALVGTLGVALLYRFGRELGGKRAGFPAALLLAVSRFGVTWSQEIRMYVWAATFGTAALWMAVRYWRHGDWRSWVGYALATAAALWTLYLSALIPLVTTLAFLLLWLRRSGSLRALGRWLAAQLAAVMLLVPWLAYSLGRIPTWSSAEPVSVVEFLRLYVVMLAVGMPVNVEAYMLPALVSLGVTCLGLVALWRRRGTAEETAGVGMLVLGVLLPAVIVFVLALPIEIPFGRLLAPRYFLPLAACYYALLGWGLSAVAGIRRQLGWLGAAAALVVAMIGVAPLCAARARRDDLISLSEALSAHRRAGDVVVLHTDKDWPLFAAQYSGDWSGIPYGAPVDEAAVDSLLRPRWAEAEAVWLVTTPDAQRVDPAGLVRAWLGDRAEATASWSFAENELAVYARTRARAEHIFDLAPSFVPPDDPGLEFGSGATLLGSWLALPRYLVGDTAHLFLYWEEVPDGDLSVLISGEVEKRVTAGPPAEATATSTRQQVDLPLTPDLTPGEYCLAVCLEEECVRDIARFDLVRRSAGSYTSTDDIGRLVDARLGESIRLAGYDLGHSQLEPGCTLELTLYWQASEVVEKRYKVFTHLVGETWNASSGNFLWGQVDSEPVNSQVPTTVWVPGEVIADAYVIPIAEDAPAGTYVVEVGLYGLVDGVRLPVFDSSGDPLGDALTLAQVEVQAP
jgi:4-amino-4-deoxy-L-arabinose transferase-like glycosyltransferase